MARWRLRNGHYLNVPGTEWEYKETDRTSGKQGRKVFAVPLFLDPNDPADHNYPGEIIVCNEPSPLYPKDIQFFGDPTPEMEPLDEAAEKISASFADKWKHPIDSLPGQGFNASLISAFEKQIAEIVAGGQAKAANPVSTAGVDPKEFAALQAQVAALMARNAELEAQPKAARRA